MAQPFACDLQMNARSQKMSDMDAIENWKFSYRVNGRAAK
jgi:hypothetical protein